MITLTDDQRSRIAAAAKEGSRKAQEYPSDDTLIHATITATLWCLNETRAPQPDDEPEPIPIGMDYISEDGYLHTWDGKAWRNDGPVSNEIRIALRMIRALTDRLVTLEGKLR